MPKPRTPRDLADARFSRELDETADELVVGEGVALDVQPAGLVLRLAAALLDGLCVLVLFVLAVFGVSRLWPRGLEPAWGAALNIVLLVVVLVLVPAAVETVTKGRSVGRFATGTRVVRVDGGAIGFRHAFTRSLVGLFELWMTFGSVALLVALFGTRPRRLGDLLAGTIVQHERLPKQRDPEVLLPPELTAWAGVADVSALPQRLENRLGAFFRGAALMRPELRAAAAQNLAAEVSAFAHPVPPVPPEVFLAGVVVLRRRRDVRALGARAELLSAAGATASARPPGFPR
ncbi:RDD family protein [Curtobacterium aurantiacum]|uniref:RDD family protein n=1 Tax=Curtobacterium aurantiacum TaxID=3236919 RepID=A0ABS5VAZ0_9MICO|nr:RDD family protein [Curtobacterium flaccumfaciens]MBT1543706.1 RDD family protein [Curtobacterium flaccumfaciens pv. flaccumfaciens]MBT1586649.1 RDD family protein [Curtobacterium flaccumfaciens pv. flaccumfaciens]